VARSKSMPSLCPPPPLCAPQCATAPEFATRTSAIALLTADQSFGGSKYMKSDACFKERCADGVPHAAQSIMCSMKSGLSDET
jgi:hypothetical protein